MSDSFLNASMKLCLTIRLLSNLCINLTYASISFVSSSVDINAGVIIDDKIFFSTDLFSSVF